jgi:hypothetical protein
VRALFSTAPPVESPLYPPADPGDDLEGGLGVREPRRPLRPTLSGAVALELPHAEDLDVRAVGDG